jgi:hypothetical protein
MVIIEINAKNFTVSNAVNGACHSPKTANMILSRKPANGWDARGANTRQFSFLSHCGRLV